MLLNDVTEMAIRLMIQHDLSGWKFKFSRGKNILGFCQYTKGYEKNWRLNKSTHAIGDCFIALSHHFVTINDETNRDTILHEIAHALSPGHGHDYYWKSVCVQIGANPERLAPKTIKSPVPKYKAVCSDCGRVFRRHHMRSAKYLCSNCKVYLSFRTVA